MDPNAPAPADPAQAQAPADPAQVPPEDPAQALPQDQPQAPDAGGALPTNAGGVTKDQLIAIGRPNGPDLQLKNTDLNLQNTLDSIKDIIQADSSITEVLNVISFLTSTDRTLAGLIDVVNSAYDGSTSGAIDPATGYYTTATGPGTDFAPAIIDLNTFNVAAPASDVKIPVSILKRRGAPGTNPEDPDSFEDMSTKVITVAAAETDSKALLSDCIKQMINLLIQTRQIFGPKGWTDLFQKVKGGGSSNRKQTHRRHRRKYSSKRR